MLRMLSISLATASTLAMSAAYANAEAKFYYRHGSGKIALQNAPAPSPEPEPGPSPDPENASINAHSMRITSHPMTTMVPDRVFLNFDIETDADYIDIFSNKFGVTFPNLNATEEAMCMQTGGKTATCNVSATFTPSAWISIVGNTYPDSVNLSYGIYQIEKNGETVTELMNNGVVAVNIPYLTNPSQMNLNSQQVQLFSPLNKLDNGLQVRRGIFSMNGTAFIKNFRVDLSIRPNTGGDAVIFSDVCPNVTRMRANFGDQCDNLTLTFSSEQLNTLRSQVYDPSALNMMSAEYIVTHIESGESWNWMLPDFNAILE